MADTASLRLQRLQMIRRAAAGKHAIEPTPATALANAPLRARKGRRVPPFIQRSQGPHTALPNSMFTTLRK